MSYFTAIVKATRRESSHLPIIKSNSLSSSLLHPTHRLCLLYCLSKWTIPVPTWGQSLHVHSGSWLLPPSKWLYSFWNSIILSPSFLPPTSPSPTTSSFLPLSLFLFPPLFALVSPYPIFIDSVIASSYASTYKHARSSLSKTINYPFTFTSLSISYPHYFLLLFITAFIKVVVCACHTSSLLILSLTHFLSIEQISSYQSHHGATSCESQLSLLGPHLV